MKIKSYLLQAFCVVAILLLAFTSPVEPVKFEMSQEDANLIIQKMNTAIQIIDDSDMNKEDRKASKKAITEGANLLFSKVVKPVDTVKKPIKK